MKTNKKEFITIRMRLVLLGILMYQTTPGSAWGISPPKAKPNWIPFDPAAPDPKFKVNLSQWDGQEVCAVFTSSTDNEKTTLCQSGIKAALDRDNDWNLETECTSLGNLVADAILPVCLLKDKGRTYHSVYTDKKTKLEIQIYNEKTKKACKARFSEPYAD
uniref:Uncharacterized protein n=1 Tax=Cacopsylla melanoneura TaxID=428564 RepID=A0A8D9FJK7_9HEMI